MKLHLALLILALIFLITSCSKEKEKISIIEEESLEMQMIKAYNEGLDYLEKGDPIYASKKFNEAELLYPQSIWAPRAALMASYTYFSFLYYSDAVIELEKFLSKYKNKNYVEKHLNHKNNKIIFRRFYFAFYSFFINNLIHYL